MPIFGKKAPAAERDLNTPPYGTPGNTKPTTGKPPKKLRPGEGPKPAAS